MNDSEKTLEKTTQNDAVLQAITELSKKIDDFKTELSEKIDEHKQESDAQFEAIRQGIVHNGVSYDRLKAEVLLLRADVKELTEEVRQNKKILVKNLSEK